MLKNYKENNNPNGEIKFLAVNLEIKGIGIGILLDLDNKKVPLKCFLYSKII